MSAPWLVGLDVDGTIILQDETMSPGVPEAVARVRDAGHVVTIATGRSWAATERWVEELEIAADHVVCSNGAVTMRRVADGWERWHVETFDPRQVLELLTERLPEAHYMVELGDGTRLFTGEVGDWSLEGGRQVEIDELGALPVSRVVVVSPGHDEEDFHRIVSETGLNEVSYAIGWTAWLDIAPQGVDKGSALARVHAELGIDGGKTLVVGDGRNDIGMFEWARGLGGRAVAMGQAPDEVKDAAGEITGIVEDGGLADALDSLLPHPGLAQVRARE
ncbi:HAD family hydrolase [Microbacterium aerolatum]|uniref:Haloacid dehalogenase n=1 Tax=Microbacterium aerolatum TaxID=153731 RepID=A0A511ADL0_9MICO|nr:HAD family hydrolase [Microbacterium aerolatum]MCK3768675.1 Cof-type HAD-IIB family hydrolase [Microbacterium aerolatum]GEK85453.1 haloacid dehalogenase [Microbacterium aerolatum]GGB31192.1 haloacid dehalogenase [Microbacterium aerolatum]